ncbi:MAG: UDP-N-acetylmuramate dehydrogenase [Ferruginibacter sp.]|nr:UDP-N-acetylmuramate dehydrogenase [Ferruginibacter sp.]
MQLQQNFQLKDYNTFGINVYAKYFGTFSTLNELQYLLQDTNNYCKAVNSKSNTLILGGGSNILFTKNYDGIVLKNEILDIEKINEDEDNIFVKVGAGIMWHDFVLYCIENDFAGVENLSFIPGTVGASPIQNIGAYGVEIKDVFFELEAYNISEKKNIVFSQSNCEFGYRDSIFKNKFKDQFVIISVTFKLNKTPIFKTSYGAIAAELEKNGVENLSIKAVSDAVIAIRKSKLPNPSQIGNAGSFFKNPTIDNDYFEKLKIKFPNIVGYVVSKTHTKLAAGWLIEQCGWKGFREADAGCHQNQALVLVNYGKAQGTQIYNLSTNIIESVKNKFGVQLQREVNII